MLCHLSATCLCLCIFQHHEEQLNGLTPHIPHHTHSAAGSMFCAMLYAIFSMSARSESGLLLLNRAGVTDWDCHEYRTGLPHGLPYGYVPRSDKIR